MELAYRKDSEHVIRFMFQKSSGGKKVPFQSAFSPCKFTLDEAQINLAIIVF